MDLADLQRLVQEHGIARVDLKVTDLLGRWHHFSVPPARLTGTVLERGLGFDGSSLRGFQPIEESDLLLRPDLDTATIDPAYEAPTLSLICDVHDVGTEQPYSRDPRSVARRAMDHLHGSGVADRAYFGPQLQFFVFDDVRYEQTSNTAYYYIDSAEGAWNAGADERPNLGYKVPVREGYAPVPPFDATAEFRWAVAEALAAAGAEIEAHHHEVGTAGQGEITTRYAELLPMADRVQLCKYVVRNTAARAGHVATFMPKPVFGENGSGMHTHQSLWQGDRPLFYDSAGYSGLSQAARYYIGGLLRHAPALLAFAAASTNSYRRLVPGFEAPVYLVYAQRNRSAAVRIPAYDADPAGKRVEFRPPDGTSNPYLAFAAMLMAGLDGVRQRIDPGDPFERNVYELPAAEQASMPRIPASLDEALQALERDRAFLTRDGVFSDDLIDRYVALKREEVAALRQRPTPFEFALYFSG